MNKIWKVLVIVSVMSTGCSVKKGNDGGGGGNNLTKAEVGREKLSPEGDIDGDLISNQDELERGTSPYLGDFPRLNVHFLQNYTASLGDGSGGGTGWSVSNQSDQGDFDFKYRVGKLLIRKDSEKEMAKYVRFKNVHYGQIQDIDFTMVRYPLIEKKKFLSDVLSFSLNKSSFDIDASNLTVTFENSIELETNHLFKEIRNLELNFYYYNHEKESYELVATELVDRSFQPGVKETFEVELSALPNRLILENYLKHGEFLITEVKNFEIPDLKTDYISLMKSMRAKSIPVIVNNPIDTYIYHVATGGGNDKLNHLLSTIFNKEYYIEENRLIQLGQFQNSTEEYTELRELRGKTKTGQWFIQTTELKNDLFSHRFTPKDKIVFTYGIDDYIAEQRSEVITTLYSDIHGDDGQREVALGNLSRNSKLKIYLRPKKHFGNYIVKHDDIFQSQGCGGGNRVCRDFRCHYERREFHVLNEDMDLRQNSTSDFLTFLGILVNDHYISLKDVLAKDGVSINWEEKDLVVTIDDIMGVFSSNEYRPDDVLKLKFISKKFNDFKGIKFISGTGRHGNFMCGPQFIKPEMRARNITYLKKASFTVSSSIENYFN